MCLTPVLLAIQIRNEEVWEGTMWYLDRISGSNLCMIIGDKEEEECERTLQMLLVPVLMYIGTVGTIGVVTACDTDACGDVSQPCMSVECSDFSKTLCNV